MKKEVIVISWIPLSSKVYDELCLNEYANKYHTEYLDLSNFYYPGVVVNNYKQHNDISEIKLNSYFNIYNYLRCKNILYAVVHIPLTSRTLFLYIILRYLGISTIFYAIGFTPMSCNNDFSINVFDFFNCKFYLITLKKFIKKLLINADFVAKPKYTLCAGEVARLKYPKSSIRFNSDDYEKSKIYNNISESKCCVFLDSYLPWHPDLKSLGISLVDESNYLLDINRFFDGIELSGYVVKVAAHPKADYHSQVYNNREVFYNKTAKLVSEAKFIVAHTSTAINFAVLYRKPIILIYNNNYYNIYKDSYYKHMLSFSKELNCSIINLSNLVNYNFNLHIDQSAYNNYIRKYISENINGLTNEEIIRGILS